MSSITQKLLNIGCGQAHHDAREVFATQDELSEDFDVVYGPATVCGPADWAAKAQEGDDVYLCEYEYYSLCWVRCPIPLI